MVSKKIIRLPEVLEITNLSKGSIYLKMKNKEFPQSVALGPNSVGWIESEIQDWVKSLIEKRDSEVA
ncbi:MAG TPA: AlpA family transcriptional regulator [Aeromonadales bacterium]|nr:AlpA family transcriptional regulator [Aeromonadales bacterium]